MYMIMALAEKAEIPYNLEAGDNESGGMQTSENQVENLKMGISELDKLKQQSVERVSPMSVPADVRQIIEETQIQPSLLEKVRSNPQQSLLNKEEE